MSDDDVFRKLEEAANDAIANKKIAITGTLSQPRVEFERIIFMKGGTPATSVSKHTHFLIVGDKPGVTKVRRAVQLGIPVIDEDDFWKMV